MPGWIRRRVVNASVDLFRVSERASFVTKLLFCTVSESERPKNNGKAGHRRIQLSSELLKQNRAGVLEQQSVPIARADVIYYQLVASVWRRTYSGLCTTWSY